MWSPTAYFHRIQKVSIIRGDLSSNQAVMQLLTLNLIMDEVHKYVGRQRKKLEMH
jgi:hypothetical protein